MMKQVTNFPTVLHQEAAGVVTSYFSAIPQVDTILLVNSCARGVAAPESDLDFAILVEPGTSAFQRMEIETAWQSYSNSQATLSRFNHSGPFAHLHLDVIEGNYQPGILEKAGPIDYFEVEIGNQICYSAPLGVKGPYFQELQNRWLPYYDEERRIERLNFLLADCKHGIDHIAVFAKRGLHFHAFDLLYKTFQQFLQALFIANKTYPIAYNKWIREQVVKWLNMPELYPKLLPILTISDIESAEIIENSRKLASLLNSLSPRSA
jgi:predicted nucleotidyltransferase